MEVAEFINIIEQPPDLVLSFAFRDRILDVKSLILTRTPDFERFFPEHERGVQVWLEGEPERENNPIKSVFLKDNVLDIRATHTCYQVDLSKIGEKQRTGMLKFLKKMNFDRRFEIRSS